MERGDGEGRWRRGAMERGGGEGRWRRVMERGDERGDEEGR